MQSPAARLLLASVAALWACAPERPPADGGGDADTSCARACDDGLFCSGVERCERTASGADDDGCVAGVAPCAAGEACDEATDTCMPGCDADGDGANSIDCGGEDCDDGVADRFPGNLEICDADDLDEDCDLATFGMRDADGDRDLDDACCNGAGAARTCGTDCDDARPGVSATGTEACDALDNDCDGAIDEGVTVSVFPDGDRDGYGTGTGSPGCAGAAGTAPLGGDCADADPARSPGATELCADSIDNDCDRTIDEMGPRTFYRDADGDGSGDPGDALTTTSCTPPSGYADNSRDCDDGRAATRPGATEECNRYDDDCSLGLPGGGIDRAEDADGDLHSPIDAACSSGYPRDDCADSLGTTYPGAPELCNRLDDDCSSGGGADPTEDADGDMRSAIGAACSGGYPKDDCCDLDARAFPGQEMFFTTATDCGSFDYDCSGSGEPPTCATASGPCAGRLDFAADLSVGCGMGQRPHTCRDDCTRGGLFGSGATSLPTPCR